MSVDTGHFVYRAFDVAGTLLYVGRTQNPEGRVRNHWSSTPWWPQVERVDWEPVGSLADASAAELRAIRNEAPLYNIDGSTDRAAARARLAAAVEPQWRRLAFQQGACRRCADARTATAHPGDCVTAARSRLERGAGCQEGLEHAMRVIERAAS